MPAENTWRFDQNVTTKRYWVINPKKERRGPARLNRDQVRVLLDRGCTLEPVSNQEDPWLKGN